jgi:hypothetical protein
LLDLRARGYDVVVLEISPVGATLRREARPQPAPLRIWRLQRDAVRARFETLGIPVARWEPPDAGFELAVEEVITLRRHTRPATRV